MQDTIIASAGARRRCVVALAGVFVPFVLGYGVCRILGLEDLRCVVAGATLTATSVGITARVLADHPEIESRRTLVLDLVWEEYTLRTAAGDKISKSHFYERFPRYRRSIAKRRAAWC